MKITSERIPDSQVVLQIELEEPELEQHKQRAYRKLVQQYVIPGFRKGKAPRVILERFLGADALVQEGLEDLLDRTAMEAVEQEKLELVARPQITDVESLDPVTFKATVPLKPNVALGDYKSLRIPWEEAQTADAEVQEALENIRRQGTPWQPADRPAQLGDLLTVDVEGYVDEEDAEAKESDENQGRRVFIEEKGISYMAGEDVTYPVPGFSQHLVGMKTDETRQFTISVPDDFTVRDLNGKEAHLTVTLHEIKEQVTPKMDNEWAKGVSLTEGEGFETIAALRTKVKSDLQERAEAQAHGEYEEKVLNALKGITTIEYPPIMVDSEIDHLLQDQDERLRGMGLSLSSYLEGSGQDPNEIRESLRSQAEDRVLRALLVSEVTEAEKIEIGDDEIQAEVDRVLESQPEGDAREQAQQLFGSPAARETIQRRLVARKAVELLTAIAREDSGAPAKRKRATARKAVATADAASYDENQEEKPKPARRSRKRADSTENK